jgi:hypothetical protein
MDSTRKSSDNGSLEQFLEDLILHIDQPEQVDLLLEILKEIKSTTAGPARAGTQRSPQAEVRADRYDILKIYPHRIARLGFVKGAENARRVSPSLPALGDCVYFLHESRSAAWHFVAHV